MAGNYKPSPNGRFMAWGLSMFIMVYHGLPHSFGENLMALVSVGNKTRWETR
jgi:hypothetical protein